MRIHTRVTIDIASGEVLRDDGFDYHGPVARVEGRSQSQKQSSKPAPLTFAEGVSQELGLDLLMKAGESVGVEFDIPDRNAISQELFGKDFADIKGRKKRQRVLDTVASQINVTKPQTEADKQAQQFISDITARERGLVTNPESLISEGVKNLVNTAYEGPAEHCSPGITAERHCRGRKARA